METYWDAYLTEIRGGKITVVVRQEGDITYREAVTLDDSTPRQLLEGFYGWLGERGQLVH